MTQLNTLGGGSPYNGPSTMSPGSAANPGLAIRTAASGMWSPGAGRLAVALSGTSLEFVSPGADGTIQATAATVSSNGLTVMRLPLLEAKNVDGTTLSASASSGKFGLTVTPGTSEYLLTEAANSNTKTDVAIWEVVLPATYIAGSDITVTASTLYTLGSGTVGTHTLGFAAYLCADAGTQGSTLIATAAQTVPATVGDVTFTITGTTLTAGARLMLTATLIIQDTGGSNITARVNSVRLS